MLRNGAEVPHSCAVGEHAKAASGVPADRQRVRAVANAASEIDPERPLLARHFDSDARAGIDLKRIADATIAKRSQSARCSSARPNEPARRGLFHESMPAVSSYRRFAVSQSEIDNPPCVRSSWTDAIWGSRVYVCRSQLASTRHTPG